MLEFPSMVICCGNFADSKKLFSMQDDENVFIPIFSDGERAAKFKAWASKAYDDELTFNMVEDGPAALGLFEVITITTPNALIAIDPEPNGPWECEQIIDVVGWLRSLTSP